MSRNFLRSLAGLVALLAGCGTDRTAGGTGVGNPVVPVAFTLRGVSSGTGGAARSLADTAGTVFRAQVMIAWVQRIRIHLPDGVGCPESGSGGDSCASGETDRSSGVAYDLATGQVLSSFSDFALPSGSYRKVEVKLGPPGSKDAAVACLGDASVCLEGEMVRAGVHRPFRLVLPVDQEIAFESASGIDVLHPGAILSAVLGLGSWLRGQDIGACLDSGKLPSGTDTLVLDSNYPCGNLENDVKDRMLHSTGLQGH